MSTENTSFKLPDHSSRDHYINGGSQMDRRVECRGSLKMELPFWDIGDETEHSKEGTCVHECGEIFLPFAMENWNKDDKFEGAPSLDSHQMKKYTESQVVGGLRYCMNILEILGDKAPNVQWVSEKKFIIDQDLELGGTADFACGYTQSYKSFAAEHLEKFPSLVEALKDQKDVKVGIIWDYKNGTIPHDAEHSNQIAQYAGAMQFELGKPPKRAFDVIFGHIYGPNFRDRRLVTSVVAFSKQQLAEIISFQRQIAEEALGMHGEDKLFLKAGEHCFFCKAKAVCKEVDRTTREKASMLIDKFNAIYEVGKSKVVLKKQVLTPENYDFRADLETKNDEEIVDFFCYIEFFTKAISATKQYIIERQKMGKPIHGLRLVESTSRRKFKEELDDKEIGQIAKGWGIESPWVKVARNLSDLEKELIQILKKQGAKGDEAKAQAQKLMEEITEKTKPGISIVLDYQGDPRESIEVKTQERVTSMLDAAAANQKQ